MGKKKVALNKKIENKLQRQLTYYKRKHGLIKKAMELSMMCDNTIVMCIISNSNNKTVVFSSEEDGNKINNDILNRIKDCVKYNNILTLKDVSTLI